MSEHEAMSEFIALKLYDFVDKAIEAKQLSEQEIVRKTIDQLLQDILTTQNALDWGVYPSE